MTQPTFEITKAATFDAAHYFAEGPEHRPYQNMHGHSFKVEATVRGRIERCVVWDGAWVGPDEHLVETIRAGTRESPVTVRAASPPAPRPATPSRPQP